MKKIYSFCLAVTFGLLVVHVTLHNAPLETLPTIHNVPVHSHHEDVTLSPNQQGFEEPGKLYEEPREVFEDAGRVSSNVDPTQSTDPFPEEERSKWLTKKLDRVLQQNELKTKRLLDIGNGILPVDTQDYGAGAQSPYGIGSQAPYSYVPFVESIERAHLVRHQQPTEGYCNDRILLLIAVTSSVQSFDRRQAIRETWGSASQNAKLGIRLVFTLGQPEEKWRQFEADVKEEAGKYGDILQLNFIDHHGNLTLKTVGLFDWVLNFCSAAHFVLKTDDDVFINVPNLLQYIVQSIHGNQSTGVLVGYVIEGAKPGEDKHSKWYTSAAVFQGEYYPKYLSGSAYLLSRDQVQALYLVSLSTPPFWLEDIYVTGILASKIGSTLVHNPRFWYRRRKGGVCEYLKLISGHELTAEDLYDVWRELRRSDLNCVQSLHGAT